MRFILNFIFFGLLFYLLWLYFPDAFQKLFSWAQTVVDYVVKLVQSLFHSTKEAVTTSPPPSP